MESTNNATRTIPGLLANRVRGELQFYQKCTTKNPFVFCSVPFKSVVEKKIKTAQNTLGKTCVARCFFFFYPTPKAFGFPSPIIYSQNQFIRRNSNLLRIFMDGWNFRLTLVAFDIDLLWNLRNSLYKLHLWYEKKIFFYLPYFFI